MPSHILCFIMRQRTKAVEIIGEGKMTMPRIQPYLLQCEAVMGISTIGFTSKVLAIFSLLYKMPR